MGISKGEWEQFNKRMDEHFAAMNQRLDALPCAAHKASIGDAHDKIEVLEKDKERIIGAAKVVGGLAGVAAALTAVIALLEKLSGKAHP